MNPSLYNITMTSEFNPFNDFRDGPPRLEPSVERELPLYDNEDAEIDFVPETQFLNPVGNLFIFFKSLIIFYYNRIFFLIMVVFFL